MKTRHGVVASILNIFVIVAAVWAWFAATDGTFSALGVSSLLAVTAFGLMWVHYVSEAIAPREQGEGHSGQYYLSRGAVLVAILTHPLLVNWHLLEQGFGFPPASYEQLLGSLAWVVALGWLALTAFLLFEVRKRLSRFYRQILHANILAMFLVLIHGFLIGMVLMQTWYVWVWWLFAISFSAIVFRHYTSYYRDNSSRRIAAYAAVAVLSIATVVAGLESMDFFAKDQTQSVNQPSEQKTASTPEARTVTSDELALSDGINGNLCWVAVDGIVYDASASSQWSNGVHTPSNGQARCGEDLSSVIGASPHGSSVLGSLPQIGPLE